MKKHGVKYFEPILGVTLSMADVLDLYRSLSEKVKEAAELQVQDIERPQDMTEEEFDRQIQHIRDEHFRVGITVRGSDHEELLGNDISILESPNIPPVISSIYFNSATAFYARNNYDPRNSFSLLLDFTKPPLLDWKEPVSSPTPNNSNLSVDSDSDTWTASVIHAVQSRIKHRNNRRSFIHKPFVYDVFLWTLGLPGAFFACYLLAPLIESTLVGMNDFVFYAAYLYVFLLSGFIYRLLFGYTRWAFPIVEMKNPSDASAGHRKFWWSVMVGIVATAIWQLAF